MGVLDVARRPGLLSLSGICNRVFFSMALVLSIILGADMAVEFSASGKVFNNLEAVKKNKVALVLGCLPGSYSFDQRIEAAAQLYHGGKVEYLLVSGDNSRREYDEPTQMLLALVRKGVPVERIYRDYAGFRTLDSIVRAREVFNLDEFVVVSQRYHLERAVFLASQKGIKATGYYQGNYQSRGMWLRESLARVKAVYDIALNTSPKFLGRQITICRQDYIKDNGKAKNN